MCYPWLCARRYYLEFLNTSDLPRRKPLVIAVLPASLSTRSAAVVVVVFFFFFYSTTARWQFSAEGLRAVLESAMETVTKLYFKRL